MNRFIDFVNKYGIVFHSLSAMFWLFLLSKAFVSLQSEDLPLKAKIVFGGSALFLILSVINLYKAVKQRKS